MGGERFEKAQSVLVRLLYGRHRAEAQEINKADRQIQGAGGGPNLAEGKRRSAARSAHRSADTRPSFRNPPKRKRRNRFARLYGQTVAGTFREGQAQV